MKKLGDDRESIMTKHVHHVRKNICGRMFGGVQMVDDAKAIV